MARQGRDLIEVEIETLAYGGMGLGKFRGHTVFVPMTIPGEVVSARVTEQHENHWVAEGVKLLDASADRVYAACPLPHCPRCVWQHIRYDVQPLLKQDILADQLERVGHIRNPNVMGTIPALEPWGYLHQVTYQVTAEGKLAIPSKTPRVITSEDCGEIHPELTALFDVLDLDLENVSKVKLQRGSAGEVTVILTMLTDSAPELELDFAASVNLILPDNTPMNLIGDAHVRYDVNGQSLRVTAGSFYRANADMVPTLVKQVMEMLAPASHERVLDLYGGVGTFSAALAPRVSLVTYVESYPPAVTDADKNLADFDNVDVLEGGVETGLDHLLAEGHTAQAAIVDPTSAGLRGPIIDQLCKIGVERLVYVSDDPSVLAKDASRLSKAGYHLQSSTAIDLSPQTAYVDSVSLFVRGS